MCIRSRFSAIAFLLAALLPAAAVRAELVPVKTKRVLLASASDEVVATASKEIFREPLVLKGHSPCVLVRVSAEMLGFNKAPDIHVGGSFAVFLDGELIGSEHFQEAPVPAPRLVSLTSRACGLPPGPHELSVTVRGESSDEVAVRARTLEVWIGAGPAVPDTISLVRTR